MKYIQFLKENYDWLMDFINCMTVGIWITDAEGRVIMVNNSSISTGGLGREEILGRYTTELLESGYILYESSVLKAIESGHEESIVQEEGEGNHSMATSVPLFDGDELDLIVCVELDITEVMRLKGLLENQKNITRKYRDELLKFLGQNNTENNGSEELVTYNVNMIRIKDMAAKTGKTDATVIITGESGTGKEVMANLIQKNSARADAPFIKVNCAAIPESLIESEFFGYEKGTFTGANVNGKIGLFELANGGTLFLDEIGDLPLQMQSKLLRVIQEREVRKIGGEKVIPVDIRFIAATNKNLKKEMERGAFRSDLYYRLFVVPIHIPPLRQRIEDIAPMANYFIKMFNEQYKMNKVICDDAIKELEAYYWPGNVRELRNVIERMAVSGSGDQITRFQVSMCLNDNAGAGDNMGPGARNQSLGALLKKYELEIIMKTVDECGSISAAARALQVNKSTISKKLKEYER